MTRAGQSHKLAGIVRVFRIEDGAPLAEAAPRQAPVAEAHPTVPKPAAKPAVADGPAPQLAKAVGSDWSEF